MQRGEVWWATLPEPAGSDPGFRRPVLVVQSDPFNQSRIATILIAVITLNLALSEARANVRLVRNIAGLAKPSVVNVSQVLTLNRGLLTTKVKTLPDRARQNVDQGLKLVLGL